MTIGIAAAVTDQPPSPIRASINRSHRKMGAIFAASASERCAAVSRRLRPTSTDVEIHGDVKSCDIQAGALLRDEVCAAVSQVHQARTRRLEYCASVIGLPQHHSDRRRLDPLRSLGMQTQEIEIENVPLSILCRCGSDTHQSTSIRGMGLRIRPLSLLLDQFRQRRNKLLHRLASAVRVSRAVHR